MPASSDQHAGPIEAALQSGESRDYNVALELGEFLHVRVFQRGIDVALELWGPTQGRLRQVDEAEGLTGEEMLSFVAEAAGDHQVRIIGGRVSGNPDVGYRLEAPPPRLPGAAELDRIQAERAFSEARRLSAVPDANSRARADALLETALAAWRRLDERYGQASALTLLAKLRTDFEGPEGPLSLAEQALALWAPEHVFDRAATLIVRGELQYHAGKPQQALDSFAAAREFARRAGEKISEAQAITNIGYVRERLGEYETALELHDQAIALWRAAGDRAGLAATLGFMATCHENLGDMQRALELLDEALALVRGTRNEARDEAGMLMHLGAIYGSLGEARTAASYYKRSLTRWREIGNPREVATALSNLGISHVKLGETQAAIGYLEEGLALRRSVGDRRGEAITLINLANALRRSQPRTVVQLLKEASSLARQVGDPRVEAFALSNLGRIEEDLGNLDSSLHHQERAKALRSRLADRRGVAVSSYLLGLVERRNGRLDRARQHVEHALDAFESLRHALTRQAVRRSVGVTTRDMYELYVDVLLRQHEADPRLGLAVLAFNASEHARARGLLELLSEAQVDLRHGIDPTLLRREMVVAQEIGALLEEQLTLVGRAHTQAEARLLADAIQAKMAVRDLVEAEIRAASPRYAAVSQPQPLTLSEIQQHVLDSDCLLLEYLLGEERSFVWAVTRDHYQVHVLPKREEIERLARSVHEEWSKPRRAGSSSTAGSAARQLSGILLGPIAEQLKGRRLLVVADGALHYIPFAALPSPNDSTRPLLLDHEVVSLPSASLMQVLRREHATRKPATKTLAAFADPVFGADDSRVQGRPSGTDLPRSAALYRATRSAGLEGGLRRLPFTRREARALGRLVPKGSAKVALDFDASEAAAIAPDLSDYRYVHFATHGFLNTAHPGLSGVVLSLVDRHGRPQDGFLSAGEVYNLKLSAELVTLSGCQTGLGQEIRGEGIVGLTRGFMHAGAPRVLASLWRVDDAATAALMSRFYQKMLGPQRLRPAAALREAQVEMWKRDRWRSPYYWAAFQLQGEWR